MIKNILLASTVLAGLPLQASAQTCTNCVTSVNGKAGPTVTLGASDVGALPLSGGTLSGGLTAPQAAVAGAGQASGFSTAGNLGGSVVLGDTGTSPNNGGAAIFSANGQAWKFAAIKGAVTNGGGNSQGDIVFYTRPTATDAALTEQIRLSSAGTSTFRGPVNVLGATTFGAPVNASLTYSQTNPSPFFNITVTEAHNVTNNGFADPFVVVDNRTGGTGNREAVHAEADSSANTPNSFEVGGTFIGHLTSGGSANAFGLNGVAWCDANVAAGATCQGAEMNTRVLANVGFKVGLQIVDVSDSTGSGQTVDAGLLIGAQPGGRGYTAGILIGEGLQSDGSDSGVVAGRTLFASKSSSRVYRAGIDLSGNNFSQFAINTPGFQVDQVGDVQTRGLQSHAGTTGGFTANFVNLYWDGACLRGYVDTTQMGCVTFH